MQIKEMVLSIFDVLIVTYEITIQKIVLHPPAMRISSAGIHKTVWLYMCFIEKKYKTHT